MQNSSSWGAAFYRATMREPRSRRAQPHRPISNASLLAFTYICCLYFMAIHRSQPTQHEKQLDDTINFKTSLRRPLSRITAIFIDTPTNISKEAADEAVGVGSKNADPRAVVSSQKSRPFHVVVPLLFITVLSVLVVFLVSVIVRRLRALHAIETLLLRLHSTPPPPSPTPQPPFFFAARATPFYSSVSSQNLVIPNPATTPAAPPTAVPFEGAAARAGGTVAGTSTAASGDRRPGQNRGVINSLYSSNINSNDNNHNGNSGNPRGGGHVGLSGGDVESSGRFHAPRPGSIFHGSDEYGRGYSGSWGGGGGGAGGDGGVRFAAGGEEGSEGDHLPPDGSFTRGGGDREAPLPFRGVLFRGSSGDGSQTHGRFCPHNPPSGGCGLSRSGSNGGCGGGGGNALSSFLTFLEASDAVESNNNVHGSSSSSSRSSSSSVYGNNSSGNNVINNSTAATSSSSSNSISSRHSISSSSSSSSIGLLTPSNGSNISSNNKTVDGAASHLRGRRVRAAMMAVEEERLALVRRRRELEAANQQRLAAFPFDFIGHPAAGANEEGCQEAASGERRSGGDSGTYRGRGGLDGGGASDDDMDGDVSENQDDDYDSQRQYHRHHHYYHQLHRHQGDRDAGIGAALLPLSRMPPPPPPSAPPLLPSSSSLSPPPSLLPSSSRLEVEQLSGVLQVTVCAERLTTAQRQRLPPQLRASRVEPLADDREGGSGVSGGGGMRGGRGGGGTENVHENTDNDDDGRRRLAASSSSSPSSPSSPPSSSCSLHRRCCSEEELARLPFVVLTACDITRSQHVSGCAICLEPWAEGDLVRTLPCMHRLHARCADPWLLHHSCLCPLCKHPALFRVARAVS